LIGIESGEMTQLMHRRNSLRETISQMEEAERTLERKIGDHRSILEQVPGIAPTLKQQLPLRKIGRRVVLQERLEKEGR